MLWHGWVRKPPWVSGLIASSLRKSHIFMGYIVAIDYFSGIDNQTKTIMPPVTSGYTNSPRHTIKM